MPAIFYYPFFLLSVLATSPSYALLISQNSSYGVDSITFDTDTGLRWLDPWLATAGGTQRAFGYNFYSYNDVKAELGDGGFFEGFRYATRQEVNTLLFSSAGITPDSSLNSASESDENAIAVDNLLALTGTTWGSQYDENEYTRLVDAVFEDENTGVPMTSVLGVTYHTGHYHGGDVHFYEVADLAFNYNPYGHWLVSETRRVAVDEPPLLGLPLLGRLLTVYLRRKGA